MAEKDKKEPEKTGETLAPTPQKSKPKKKVLLMVLLPLVTFAIFVFLFSNLFGVDIGVALSPPPPPDSAVDSTRGLVDTTLTSMPDSADTILSEIGFERQEIESLRNEIKGYAVQKETRHREDIRALAKLYDGIKEEQLAYIFEHMEDSLIVLILPEMKARNASKALELVKPERAAVISKMILEKKP
ncbi:MAG: hypothetical protein CO189_09455 [candidate division Zixibacteria bacterium CG_4_9_14_3_um_filter_46_8]|nr:MAG: hypothetical protein CO189_09455 [candidate division Zixibacteria bacterium CG_4_9_14_3_um_filter_46_8]